MPSEDLVLVTGAGGFLGANLVRALLRSGYRVRCLVRSSGAPPSLAGLAVEIVQGDVREPDAVRRALRDCGALVHTAACYTLGARRSREIFSVNVIGTRVVMEEALRAATPRIVHTSSVSAVGPVPGRAATEEDSASPARLPGAYERSKRISERLVSLMVARQALPAVIVNPSTIVGAWDSRPTRTGQLIIDTARGRMPAYVRTGMNVITAEDAALGHVLALRYGQPGRRYILGNENLTLLEFLRRIDHLLGRRSFRFPIPHLAALVAAGVDEHLVSRLLRREPLIPLAGARQARCFMYYDPGRARSELGLPATPVEEGLAAALAWFRAHRHL